MGKPKQKALDFIGDELSEFFEAERTDPDHPNKITGLSLKNLDRVETSHLNEPLQKLLEDINSLLPVNSHSSLRSPSHTASKVMELLETFFKSNTDAVVPEKLQNLIDLRAKLPKSRSEIMLLPPEEIKHLSQNLCVIAGENFDENQQLSLDIFLNNLTNFLNSKKSIAMFVPTPQKQSESEILTILNNLIVKLSDIEARDIITEDIADTSFVRTPQSESEILPIPNDSILNLSYIEARDIITDDIADTSFVPTPQSESEILPIPNDSILNLSDIEARDIITDDMADTSHYSPIIEEIIKNSHHPVFNNPQIKTTTPNIWKIIKLAREHAGKPGRTKIVTKELDKRYHHIIDTVKEGERSGELVKLQLIIDTKNFVSAVVFDGEGFGFKHQQPSGRDLRRVKSEPAYLNHGISQYR